MSSPKHKTILVVDDDKDAADELAKFIESEGHRVLTAYDKETGLELAGKASLDIIFHDVGMPGGDGYMAARVLRSDSRFKATLLIAIMTEDVAPNSRQALLAGFDVHISKPINRDALRLILGRRPVNTG